MRAVFHSAASITANNIIFTCPEYRETGYHVFLPTQVLTPDEMINFNLRHRKRVAYIGSDLEVTILQYSFSAKPYKNRREWRNRSKYRNTKMG